MVGCDESAIHQLCVDWVKEQGSHSSDPLWNKNVYDESNKVIVGFVVQVKEIKGLNIHEEIMDSSLTIEMVLLLI